MIGTRLPDWALCSCDFCKKMTKYFNYDETMRNVGECIAMGSVKSLANIKIDRVNGPVADRLASNATITATSVLVMLLSGHITSPVAIVELETAISMAEGADIIRQLTALDKVSVDG